MKKTAQYIVNIAIHGYKKGAVLDIDVDENGTPIARQWRRRLKDAKIDKCISLKKPKTKKKDIN